MSNLSHQAAIAIRDVNDAFSQANQNVSERYKTPEATIQQAQAIAVGRIVAHAHITQK